MTTTVVDTTRQSDAQREEQRRQTFRLWLGGCLSASLLFLSLLVFQTEEDTPLHVALYAFITAIVLSIAAFFVREAGNHTTREYDRARFLAVAAGICTFFGLIEAVAHYDGLAALYLFVIAIVGVIIIRRPGSPRAAS